MKTFISWPHERNTKGVHCLRTHILVLRKYWWNEIYIWPLKACLMNVLAGGCLMRNLTNNSVNILNILLHDCVAFNIYLLFTMPFLFHVNKYEICSACNILTCCLRRKWGSVWCISEWHHVDNIYISGKSSASHH